MLVLSFLLTWLAHVIVLKSQDIPKSVNFDGELESEMDKIADEMLSAFAEAHAEPLQRRKRQTMTDSKSLIDEIGVHRLQTITPVSQLCYPAVHTTFVDVGSVTYAICASAETQESPAEVIVGTYKEHVWTPIAQWYVVHPNSLSAFHINGFLYVIVADSGKTKGMDLVKIDLASNKRNVEYIVYSKPATSISIWKMKTDNNFHMAIANLAAHSNDLASDVYVYEWMHTYYDRYSTLPAYDVRDIEPFYIHDTPYLAIANYRKSINNFEVDSEIFKFNLDKGWISHQKIRTYGANDWEFFTLGSGITKEFFLAVANKEDNDVSEAKSMIYKFAKDIFVPFQCLPIFRASSLASWSTKTAFILAVASSEDAVHMFQYDGWRFVQSRTQYTQRAMSVGVNSLIFHNITRRYEEIPILSVSNQMHRDLSIFEIGLKHENELQAWRDKSTEWCFNTLQKLESTDDTNTLIRALDDVFFIDQETPIVIEGDLYFEKGFEVSKLQTPQLKEIVTEEVYDNSILLKLGEMNKRLEDVNAKLQVYEEVLKNALQTEGNQTVYGHLTFQDAVLDCEKYACQFDSINTVYLNGEDITDWSKNLVFLDSDRIDGTLIADKISATNINVNGLIDGVDSKTLVTKSGQHFITGPKTFVNDIIASEVEVHGKVDGIKISQSDVLLTTGLQNVTGNLIFEEIDTAWLKGTYVNNVDLSKFLNDVVRSDQPATITGEKIFHDVIVDELHMAPGSTINGVDIADLWANALWKDKDQTITAPMTFHSVNMEKNLFAPFGINGISIPGPRIVDINDFANITEPKVFTQPTKISNLEVLNSINDLGIQSVEGYPPQLDIMLKSGNQAITGKKIFHTIHLDADSYVTGTVDGVDLSELKAITLSKDATVDTDRTWTFNNLVIKGPLTANKISGHNLEDIYERALKLNDTNLPEMTFKKNLQIDDLESYDINGYNFQQDFVLKNKPQTLTGTKTFYDIVLEENSIVLSTINNINMKVFNNTLLRIGNQVLKSKVFHKNVKVNKLIVKGSINGIPVDNFVSLNDDVLLHARELYNVTFQEIEAGSLEVAGTVNGIDVEEMIKDTLTYEGDQEVKGTLIVKGTINTIPDGNLNVGTINGVNISELWEDAVLIDGSQVITGEKTFTDSVMFQNLDFKDTIDGVSGWDMNNWMLRDQPQVVEGNVKFLNDVTVSGIRVNGLINGINITELDESVVKVNEAAVIEGPVIFENTVISLDDITLSGNVNGIDLSEEAVTKSGEKVITGAKTFTKDLVIDGDLTVSGKVDGVSIADICENTLVVKKEQNITHLTIKGDVTLTGGGLIGGKIAGVDLEELRKVVALDEDSFMIDGYKVFENLTIEGPVILEGKLGGVNLNELQQTYMSLTRDQVIDAPMQFEEINFNGTLSAGKFDSHDSLVNGINIKNLNERIMKKDGVQTITAEHYYDEVVFLDDVFVTDQVNGLEVPSGLMRRNKPNYILSPKVFEKPVTVLGDLDVAEGKHIQYVDVSDWNKKAVLTEGTFEIAGHKTFKGLEVTDVKVDGLLDGLQISDEALLMTYGEQVITGQKTIKGAVEIKGSLTVNGLINGISLDDLSRNTLQHDRENTITGAKYFTEPLTIKSLQAPTVSGVDVVELQKKINTKLDYEKVQNRLEEINEVITKVQDALEKQAVVFQYYELFQEFEIPRAYSWLYLWNKDCGEILLLADNSSSVDLCSSIRIFKYNEEQKQYLPEHQELQTSYATSIKSLVIEGKTFLFVGNQNPKSFCLEGKPDEGIAEVDIYKWTAEGFELFQTIPMSPIIQVGVFTDDLISCVFSVEMRSTTIYCTSTLDEEFTFRETLPTIGCRKADIIKSHGKIVLALAAEDLRPRSINYIPENNVDIYFWNYEAAMFSKPVQGISSKYVQSLLLMDYHTGYSSYLFLVIAGGRIPKLQEEPKVTIYRYENTTAKFHKYQEIQANGELEWLVLKTGELILFVLEKEKGTVKLFEHKGASGFVHVDTINSIGTISIHPFIRHHDKEDGINHYLAFAGPHAAMAQPAQGLDYAKILKSKVKGRRYFIEN